MTYRSTLQYTFKQTLHVLLCACLCTRFIARPLSSTYTYWFLGHGGLKLDLKWNELILISSEISTKMPQGKFSLVEVSLPVTHLVTGSSKKCSFVQTNLSFYDIKQIYGFLVQNLKSWNYRKYNIRVDILIEKGELLIYASLADLC